MIEVLQVIGITVAGNRQHQLMSYKDLKVHVVMKFLQVIIAIINYLKLTIK
jgi:hypothetical protein